MRLLVVEDEERVAAMLAQGLREEGHLVARAATGLAAQEQGLTGGYDVILLDWALPDVDGVSVLRAWRQRGLRTPVMLLTARGATAEKVEALRAGADDYLVKPFAFDELVARLEALQRRAGADTPRLGDVLLDGRRRALVRDDRSEPLTSREYGLLAELAAHAGEALSRAQLMQAVWGPDFAGNGNVVDVYVGYVRTKLERVGAAARVEAVRGVGYRLALPEAR